jgi:putative flippase GtrA
VGGLIERSRFLRFLLSGGVNTITTYATYLVLLQLLDYRVAYTVAYVFGILLAYVLNWLFVFRVHRGLSSVLLFPFVYVAQYVASLAAVWIWVQIIGFSKYFAPLIAIAITIPLTYAVSKIIFLKKKRIAPQ